MACWEGMLSTTSHHCCCSRCCTPHPCATARRQGGWLSDFAELGERARGQLLEGAHGQVGALVGHQRAHEAEAHGPDDPINQVDFVRTVVASRARPLARRLEMILRPLAVAIRARKPWDRFRLMLLGW